MNEGDKVLLIDGSIAEFIRAKRSKFIGVVNAKRYDIPFSMLKEIVEKVDINKKKEENKNLLKQLKKR